MRTAHLRSTDHTAAATLAADVSSAAIPAAMPAVEAPPIHVQPAAQPVRRVLIIIPTYNEVTNVGPLSARIFDTLPDAELLFIDDNSPDGTAARIAELRHDAPRIHLLSRHAKLGLGTAYLTGFRYGLAEGYDVVVTMDADLSHDPAYLPALIAASAKNDVVIGSRYVAGGGVRHWGLHRRLLSRFANLYARRLLAVPVRDCTSGFRAYRTAALSNLPLERIRSSGYAFLEEMSFLAVRHGCRVEETPIIFVDRHGGRSKISIGEIFLAAYHVLRLRLQPTSS